MPVVLLNNGHKSLITIAGITAAFEEIEVQSPALDAGGPINQTTMRNNRGRTQLGKPLIGFGKCSIKVAYDPAVVPQMTTILGQNRQITRTYPNGNTYVFWGFVDKFTEDPHKSEDRPEAMLDIEVSNLNSSLVETLPVFTAATTTTTTPAP